MNTIDDFAIDSHVQILDYSHRGWQGNVLYIDYEDETMVIRLTVDDRGFGVDTETDLTVHVWDVRLITP